jgi:hypothetical protein
MESAASDIRVLTDQSRTIDLRGGSAGSDRRQWGLADRSLRWGTTTLLLVIGIVHLHLWEDGYRTLPTIGPLFIVAAASAGLIGLFTSVQLNWATAAAGAGFALGTLAANVLSGSASARAVRVQGTRRFVLWCLRHRVGSRRAGARRLMGASAPGWSSGAGGAPIRPSNPHRSLLLAPVTVAIDPGPELRSGLDRQAAGRSR